MRVGETFMYTQAAHNVEVYGANMAAQFPVYTMGSEMGIDSEGDMFVHRAPSVCPAGPSLSAAPTGLTEVGYRNADGGLTTLLVPSCPEESWICS